MGHNFFTNMYVLNLFETKFYDAACERRAAVKPQFPDVYSIPSWNCMYYSKQSMLKVLRKILLHVQCIQPLELNICIT